MTLLISPLTLYLIYDPTDNPPHHYHPPSPNITYYITLFLTPLTYHHLIYNPPGLGRD